MRRILVLLVGLGLVWGSVCATAQTPSPTPVSPTYSNASLSGTYVFRLHAEGRSNITPYTYSMIGTLTSDGSGTITSGQFDLNNGATASPQTPEQLTGSYTIGTDGRGQVTLNVASANLPNKSSGSLVLSLVLESSARGRVVEVAQNETASGVLQKQAAAPSLAMISGAYATSGFALMYSFPSIPSGPARGIWLGQVTANGAGNITGTIDANVPNNPQPNFPVAGTFALVNGRAMGSSSGVSVVLYPVDNTIVYLMSLGPQTTLTSGTVPPELLGTLELQQ